MTTIKSLRPVINQFAMAILLHKWDMPVSIHIAYPYITCCIINVYSAVTQGTKSSTNSWKVSQKIITTGHIKSILCLSRTLKLQFSNINNLILYSFYTDISWKHCTPITPKVRGMCAWQSRHTGLCHLHVLTTDFSCLFFFFFVPQPFDKTHILVQF